MSRDMNDPRIVEFLSVAKAVIDNLRTSDAQKQDAFDSFLLENLGFTGWSRNAILNVLRAILENAPDVDVQAMYVGALEFRRAEAASMLSDMMQHAEQEQDAQVSQ